MGRAGLKPPDLLPRGSLVRVAAGGHVPIVQVSQLGLVIEAWLLNCFEGGVSGLLVGCEESRLASVAAGTQLLFP